MDNRILENKTALIHGGGGAIGGAIARAFARHGARVFLAGGTRAKLDAVALHEVANTAAFLASDQANAMTGAVANLSCGALVD